MEIPKSVVEFLDKCTGEVGKCQGDMFNQDVWSFLHDRGIESPIEQMLYAALRTVQELNVIDDADPVESNGEPVVLGLSIEPQHEVGRYRVDFCLCYSTRTAQRRLIVECDSQAWHERSEKERRYEKRRDRFLAAEGLKVFHYTGREIMENPMRVAKEIIVHVTGIHPELVNTDAT